MKKQFLIYISSLTLACTPIFSSSTFLEYLSGNGDYMSSNAPLSCHKVSNISTDGHLLELEDGSQWKVPQYDSYKLKYWRPGDLLEISPCESFFSSYSYWLTNTSSNNYVKANLYKAPHSAQETQNTSIKEISANHLVLDNGMSWEICSEDVSLLSKWDKKDNVLIGTNSTWLTSYDNILINCSSKNFVRAKPVDADEDSKSPEKGEGYPSLQE